MHARVEEIGRLAQWLEATFRRASRRDNEPGRIAVGRRGERMAERELVRRGYRIVERNFRAAGAEIDLIAIDGDTLVFIEVKTRRTVARGTPADAVDPRKQSHIRRAAGIFAARNRSQDRPIRFDVVAILDHGPGPQVEIIRDAF